jgi:TolB protein
MLDVATSTSTRLTTNSNADYSPVWSPDGTKIAFSTFIGDNYEIATMSPDGSNIVNVTKAAQGDFVPRWSADGNKISFISNRDGGKDLYVMNADGTGQFRLTTTSQDVQEHQWRP